MNFDEFKAGALRLDHVTDCIIDVVRGNVQIVVEAYLARDDGSVERGRAFVELTQEQYTEGGWSTPGPWLLRPFDRGIADKHEGYTRYATPEEIAAYRAAKGSGGIMAAGGGANA